MLPNNVKFILLQQKGLHRALTFHSEPHNLLVAKFCFLPLIALQHQELLLA